jgi:hypothetical protein
MVHNGSIAKLFWWQAFSQGVISDAEGSCPLTYQAFSTTLCGEECKPFAELIFCTHGPTHTVALRIAVHSSFGLFNQLCRPSDTQPSVPGDTVFIDPVG